MSTTEQRFAEYEEALKKAQSYDLNAFQNQFQKDYGEATKYNQDLINQQSTALGQLQSVAPTLRQKYANSLITNPTDQMALIAQARQAPLMDYSNAVNLLSARGNKYQDILAKALGGYQTSANQANTNAENLWRLYQDAVQQDQFNEQMRRSGGGGGGTTDNSLTSLLDRDGNGILDIYEQGETQPKGPEGPTQKTPQYWSTLTKAAQWEPKNKTLANIYNKITDTVGKYIYENPLALAYPFLVPGIEAVKTGKNFFNLLKKKK